MHNRHLAQAGYLPTTPLTAVRLPPIDRSPPLAGTLAHGLRDEKAGPLPGAIAECDERGQSTPSPSEPQVELGASGHAVHTPRAPTPKSSAEARGATMGGAGDAVLCLDGPLGTPAPASTEPIRPKTAGDLLAGMCRRAYPEVVD